MAALLPPAAADRLVKLAGMLGSSYDGERANAAAACTRLLHDHGLTWREVLAAPAAKPAGPPPTGWRAIVAECLLMPERLTEWERGFLRNLPVFSRLSDRQQQCLDRIAARVLADRA